MTKWKWLIPGVYFLMLYSIKSKSLKKLRHKDQIEMVSLHCANLQSLMCYKRRSVRKNFCHNDQMKMASPKCALSCVIRLALCEKLLSQLHENGLSPVCTL